MRIIFIAIMQVARVGCWQTTERFSLLKKKKKKKKKKESMANGQQILEQQTKHKSVK